ncbi:MAG: hypothetical protein AB1650_01505 [Candidatus Omnitrophota bacterium]
MKKFLIVMGGIALLAGCAYQPQRQILKEDEVGNSRTLGASRQAVYNAFLKTALLKNFIIKEEDAAVGSILAERAVEKGKRTYIVSLQARIFEDAPEKSSLFINGSERCERTFVRDNTRFFLFIIPLPGGGGKEASSIVESVKALRDHRFYDDFFSMVQANIIEPTSPAAAAGSGAVETAPDEDEAPESEITEPESPDSIEATKVEI